MANKLYLIRHGKVDANGFIGHTDLPLNPEGIKDVEKLKAKVAEHNFDQIYSSQLRRCTETANLLGYNSPQIRNDMIEVNFGDWEQKTFEEIAKENPELVDKWANRGPDFAFPGGEAISDFHKRIKTLAESLFADPADSLLLITHAGVIRHLLCYFLDLSMFDYLKFKIETASLTHLSLYGDGVILNTLNLRS